MWKGGKEEEEEGREESHPESYELIRSFADTMGFSLI